MTYIYYVQTLGYSKLIILEAKNNLKQELYTHTEKYYEKTECAVNFH
jgi:hypothetical protein